MEDELAQMKRGVLTGARASAPQQLPEGRPIRCGAVPVPTHACAATCCWSRCAGLVGIAQGVGECLEEVRWMRCPPAGMRLHGLACKLAEHACACGMTKPHGTREGGCHLPNSAGQTE